MYIIIHINFFNKTNHSKMSDANAVAIGGDQAIDSNLAVPTSSKPKFQNVISRAQSAALTYATFPEYKNVQKYQMYPRKAMLVIGDLLREYATNRAGMKPEQITLFNMLHLDDPSQHDAAIEKLASDIAEFDKTEALRNTLGKLSKHKVDYERKLI